MLSLLLITALAVQTPQTSKPATDTTAPAPRRTTTAAPRGTSASAISRQAFHDRMRELWGDHIVYTRNFIVSAAAAQADTSEVLQRLLRNQDEIGEAIKPYYGDAAGTQLASLLRNHIQLAGKALVTAKGTTTAMTTGMNMQDSRMTDTVSVRTDSAQIKAQYPTAAGRMSDTAKVKASVTVRGDTTQKNAPSNPAGYVQNRDYTSTQATQAQMGQQVAQVDSNALNQAVTALKANGDSIAAFLTQANPRGFQREAIRTAIQMHLTLLLQEVTAHLKKDWSGSIAAFDESQRQAQQMADVLSDGIMKQFPSRFSNKATTVSSR
jgi:hypothetical protein